MTPRLLPGTPAMVLFMLGSFFAGPLAAADNSAPTSLSVEPATIALHGKWDRQQLVVTGRFESNSVRDLTHSVTYTVQSPEIVTVTSQGVVLPTGNGSTVVSVRQGAVEVKVAVQVAEMDQPSTVSFRRHIEPILTKAGCNAGACHGTPSGKNGFRLSLRGYDPSLDIRSLTHDSQSRRVNTLAPDESLILLKASGQIPHEGGRRFDKNSYLYAQLKSWIAEGANDDSAASPQLTRLEVFPRNRDLDEPGVAQQLRVVADFGDGSNRDVTHLARYSVNAENIAVVDPSGRLTKKKKGEVAVIAEYMNQMATARVLFLDHSPAFTGDYPAANNEIDQHVFAKLKLMRIEPSPLCTDAEFLRRSSLDATGRLPTPDDVRSFLASTDSHKREKWIGTLLERPEFADWWALMWTDRLGCNQRFVGKLGAVKYHRWIHHAVADNMPEDEFARTILTARGGNYSVPPASFYRRVRDPQVRAEEVAQLFLGVRIGCAKCHNHPGERWTQDDYYGLAAFFARIRYRDGPFFIEIYNKEETVYSSRDGEVVQARTQQVAPPKFLGGPAPTLRPAEDRVEALAVWLTSPENPFFARAAVNRIWYHLFGRGIVDPVDDLRSTNPPCNEDLFDALAADFVKNHYDRKYLIRKILLSRTYQLSWQTTATNADDDKYFSHAKVRLPRAEALLDAICSATETAEKFPQFPAGTSAASLPDGEYKHPFLEAFGRPARAMACECERDTDTNLSQALQLVGGQTVQDKLKSDKGRIARLINAKTCDAEIVEELFLATFSRYPTVDERELVERRLANAGNKRRKVGEDILWALLNHKEFLFQR
jgi:hypothetical protein